MEKRIALELRGRTPAQVNELNLDNCRSTNIVGLTDEYCNLETLSLNNVGLTSLKGFPALPNLKRLELSDNRISCGLNFLNGSPKLTHLNISGNKIKELKDLQPLKDFDKLKNLDLFNNDVTQIEDYRKQVFTLNPSLKYLDGFDQKDCEADDSDGEGEEDELNGNNDSDGDVEGADEDGDLDDVTIDFGSLVLDDTVSEGHTTTPWPVVVYTVFGLLFHMGSLIQRSDEEDDDEDEGEDISLSAVYNDNLEEESSESSLFDGSSGGDGEDDEDEIDEEDENEAQNNTNAAPGQEESTRGKKRKHEEDGEPEN